jgi:nucleoid-associated protein YgaU
MPSWRSARILSLAAPFVLGGCSYVHFGKLPPPVTELRDEKLLVENSDLRSEKKLLQQELELTRAEGKALRMAIENRTADGDTSKQLAERLAASTREITQLRADYAKLLADSNPGALNTVRAEATELRSRLGVTEDKLAESLRTYTQLQEEVGKLRAEITRTREENSALNEQIKVAITQSTEDQATLSQLNTQLLTQKEARTRAEQEVVTLRTQLAGGGSPLAQLRTSGASEARTLGPDSAEVVVLKEQIEAYQSRVIALETERDQLRQQASSIATHYAPTLADVEAKLATALKENTALTTELSAFRAGTAPAAEVNTLRDQLRDVQAQVTALTEENARLKTRLNTEAPPVRIALTGGGNGHSDTGVSAPKAQGSSVTASLTTSAGGATRNASQTLHTVSAGDTLAKISTQYYGTPNRWSDILSANRDVLGESNNLIIGRSLRIP